MRHFEGASARWHLQMTLVALITRIVVCDCDAGSLGVHHHVGQIVLNREADIRDAWAFSTW